MAVSAGFRLAMKSRTRRLRRQEVVFFFLMMAVGLWGAGLPFRWSGLWFFVGPYCFAIGRIYSWQVFNWDWQRRVVPVSSLDDRAMVEYGVVFDELGEVEQKALLRRYQVGTYLMNFYPDERETEQRGAAHLRAYDLMKVLLPSLAVVYWAGWHLLPAGRVRAGWTNAPVMLTWMFLLVLALPQMVQMWTEPDEVSVAEPRVIEREV
jgi:hypothetical protein